ncbi:hypothetical protein [Cupriavidus pauculus]|uniref:hypothetical protein n=1 Tax=Cupriavidus pauculus TaxID=82633 RepID=UPI0012471673|nr:hypothetical protein [Cupriavidus pauculus]KAB0605308.1 hypothetical protein F7R19_01960 [Cupriavidus pauculus]UAK99671.1 hypothetical protein K8O84_17160 [Cupriavidus pauculus]
MSPRSGKHDEIADQAHLIACRRRLRWRNATQAVPGNAEDVEVAVLVGFIAPHPLNRIARHHAGASSAPA